MGRVEDLAERFGRHMQVPVSVTGVAAERVLIVVYDKELERPLRERFGEFQNQAEAAGRYLANAPPFPWDNVEHFADDGLGGGVALAADIPRVLVFRFGPPLLQLLEAEVDALH